MMTTTTTTAYGTWRRCGRRLSCFELKRRRSVWRSCMVGLSTRLCTVAQQSQSPSPSPMGPGPRTRKPKILVRQDQILHLPAPSHLPYAFDTAPSYVLDHEINAWRWRWFLYRGSLSSQPSEGHVACFRSPTYTDCLTMLIVLFRPRQANTGSVCIGLLLYVIFDTTAIPTVITLDVVRNCKCFLKRHAANQCKPRPSSAQMSPSGNPQRHHHNYNAPFILCIVKPSARLFRFPVPVATSISTALIREQ
jgi:hypothetical protein